MAKEKKLYRLESLKPFSSFELSADAEFDIDFIGEIDSFRVYASSNKDIESYLIDLNFKNLEELILKVRVLNEE